MKTVIPPYPQAGIGGTGILPVQSENVGAYCNTLLQLIPRKTSFLSKKTCPGWGQPGSTGSTAVRKSNPTLPQGGIHTFL